MVFFAKTYKMAEIILKISKKVNLNNVLNKNDHF